MLSQQGCALVSIIPCRIWPPQGFDEFLEEVRRQKEVKASDASQQRIQGTSWAWLRAQQLRRFYQVHR